MDRSKIKMPFWQNIFIKIGLLGALQFLLLTSIAMWVYPGGTLHQPGLESYSFFNNYFSDLGRTRTFDQESNLLCHQIFKITLTITGLSIVLFSVVVPFLFSNITSKVLGVLVMIFGVQAGVSYIFIGWLPWDLSYWNHSWYVRAGFMAFLGMTSFYIPAILLDRNYPNKYAYAFMFFALILFVQIVIMLFGPRAYRNSEALFLQAVAQKVVVYSEILVMIYQAIGARAVASK